MKKQIQKLLLVFFLVGIYSFQTYAQYEMEKLNRGVVAVRSGNNNFISWRWLGTEDDGITFNLYRNSTKVNANPLTVCNYQDNGAAANASYYVRAIVNGVEQSASETVTVWAAQFLKIPLQTPPGGTTPSGEAYTYNANDASVADLDGDGIYEIILKWDPSNAKDNSQSGYTGNTYVDAYKLDGTRMWRIDFGVNIRSGAHYMDFMVYDFNGDGKAEMMARTADGTKDGTGKVIGSATADYRSTAGYVLTGPEFFTVFNGMTGAAMATQNYWPARGTVSSWGDNYGNRVDRFKAGVAYLDGKKPSGIFFRGYYTRMTVAAWDWNGTTLSNRWNFDSGTSSSNEYYSQGAHSISIADVDDDGKQEIICGAAIVDDNGTGYFSTKYGHGDALHVSDMDPDLPGLEVFHIQEPVANQGMYMYNAKTKKVLWAKPTLQDGSQSEGPGRGVCADITADYKGAESWVSGGGIGGTYDCKGNQIATTVPSSCNFLVWWDGDLQRELLNNTMIDKYGPGRILTAYNLAPIASNNGSKSTPSLSGDIIGDWREEVIWRGSANDALYLFTTTTPSTYKFRTLMHDPQYRVAIAWQNTGYNQPPHLSYYLGGGMTTPAKPNITIIGEGAKDCYGVVNGKAYLDDCQVCVGGTTGKTACVQDCNATWGGTASVDQCKVCAGGTTGIVANSSCRDCNNQLNGTAGVDACGRCAGGTTGITACPTIFEFESLSSNCVAMGITESTNAGFKGTGYLNLDNAIGSDVSFELNAAQTKVYSLNVRYSNGSANDRAMQVFVNGQLQITNLSFPSTSSWTTWQTVSVNLNLTSKGSNMVRMVSLTAEGAPNLDALATTGVGVTEGDCIVTAVEDESAPSKLAYPNPFVNEFTVESQSLSTVSLLNIFGEEVYKGSCEGRCNFGSNIPAGTYTLIITENGQTKTVKIVKQ